MKPLFVLITALCFCNKLSAQKAELSVIANGGLFHYTGVSSAKVSFVNYGSYGTQYTNDVYGNKNAFSYGAALQLKLISKGGFIAGLQSGYDVLRSRVDISSSGAQNTPIMTNQLTGPLVAANHAALVPNNLASGETIMASFLPSPTSALLTGETILSSAFININPFVGYRIINKAYTLDALPGIDIALGISSREKSKITTQSTGTYTKTEVDRGKPKADFRLRLGAEAGYKNWSLSVSYASGKSNYMRDYIGSNPQAYSSYLRFGIGYRIL